MRVLHTREFEFMSRFLVITALSASVVKLAKRPETGYSNEREHCRMHKCFVKLHLISEGQTRRKTVGEGRAVLLLLDEIEKLRFH